MKLCWEFTVFERCILGCYQWTTLDYSQSFTARTALCLFVHCKRLKILSVSLFVISRKPMKSKRARSSLSELRERAHARSVSLGYERKIRPTKKRLAKAIGFSHREARYPSERQKEPKSIAQTTYVCYQRRGRIRPIGFHLSIWLWIFNINCFPLVSAVLKLLKSAENQLIQYFSTVLSFPDF